MPRLDPHRRRALSLRWAGGVLSLAGLVVLGLGLAHVAGMGLFAGDLGLGTVGWGALLEGVLGIAHLAFFRSVSATVNATATGLAPVEKLRCFAELGVGAAAWVGGWGLLALGLEPTPAVPVTRSPAVGAPLYPRLARYRDFYGRTLLAYGGGLLLAELALVLLHTLLASGAAAGGEAEGGMPPVVAFSIALLVGAAVAFGGGFLGAARARRLAIPEATVAIIYFGLPLPMFLTVMGQVPRLMVGVGYRLREVTYLAGLLGRPELGYWLVFTGLVLAMFLGITSGFVATSSGRVDLRAGFELFVANRHVSVFRPGLLSGAFAVLILGIVPPLLVFAMLRAAEAAVERTRVRSLGFKDPLRATEALNELKGREQSPTAMMTALSVGGVGVGVMALIIVMSVMSGFEIDLQQKILGTNAHVVVLKYSDSIENYPEVMDKIRGVRGVAGQTPFILNEVMLSSEGNISGVMIKGIDPKTVGSVTDLPKYMLPGGSIDFLAHPDQIGTRRLGEGGMPAFGDPIALDDGPAPGPGKKVLPSTSPSDTLDDDPVIVKPKPHVPTEKGADVVLPGIVLGRELAWQMKVVVGDRVNVVSPLGGELGPQGPMAKVRPFRVAGVFYSGFYEYDSKFVYILLDEAQAFFHVKGATGIELKVHDIDDARRVAKAVSERLEGYPYRTKDWGEMNRNLFSALRLEKLVMAIILSIIVIVAAGLIVATVIMLVLEKRKEIAVLKALGVSDGGVVKIFLAEGLQIGVAGGLLGLLAGLSWCFIIERVGIKLDPEVYYIPSLPVRIEPIQTALSVVIAVLVTFLASIYPALKASQVEPVDGLKAE